MTYTKQELKWFAERYWQEGGYLLHFKEREERNNARKNI